MPTNKHHTITVLGAGSWGTALALHLARKNFPVRLWSNETAEITALIKDRVNTRYIPDQPFPDNLVPEIDLATAIKKAEVILIAVPSVGFRSVVTAIKPLLQDNQGILWATKGIDPSTNELFHDVAIDILGARYPLAVLSGPSFAREVAKGLPTAVVIASQQIDFAQKLITFFNSPVFRTYLSTDVIGVEVGGVVKNVLAIATGISDGMELGANSRCALITRGLAEMIRFGVALGGKPDTFIGLTGVGDLVLTATDDQSRNRRFGLAIGKGQSALEAEREINQVIEGKFNTAQLMALAKSHKIEMPITEMVFEILQNRTTPKAALKKLLARETKEETR
ncbi:MAG: NAD(P)H-dependent glycerol-3-phosphate dehydrogenase [Gammaproteobacteria bacterium]|nr:NAD(P)H-dependent glycerol-3-phosphate dehydrogenase [Gammaproteobacteria bacterium]